MRSHNADVSRGRTQIIPRHVLLDRKIQHVLVAVAGGAWILPDLLARNPAFNDLKGLGDIESGRWGVHFRSKILEALQTLKGWVRPLSQGCEGMAERYGGL